MLQSQRNQRLFRKQLTEQERWLIERGIACPPVLSVRSAKFKDVSSYWVNMEALAGEAIGYARNRGMLGDGL